MWPVTRQRIEDRGVGIPLALVRHAPTSVAWIPIYNQNWEELPKIFGSDISQPAMPSATRRTAWRHLGVVHHDAGHGAEQERDEELSGRRSR